MDIFMARIRTGQFLRKYHIPNYPGVNALSEKNERDIYCYNTLSVTGCSLVWPAPLAVRTPLTVIPDGILPGIVNW
jgi:hypothetical protein